MERYERKNITGIVITLDSYDFLLFLWWIPISPNGFCQINVVKRLAEGLLFFCLISMSDRFRWDVGSWILSSNHLFHFIRKSIRNSPTNPPNQIIKKWRNIVHNHFACLFVYSFIYSLIVTRRIPGRDIQKNSAVVFYWRSDLVPPDINVFCTNTKKHMKNWKTEP